MRTDVGIGEYLISSTPGDVLKTYALGSCVAVLMYDKARKIAGLIHIALPESGINPKKAEAKPAYFADTGIPLFLQAMKKAGANRNTTWIKIAGGSNIMDEQKTFDIGRRNTIAIKRYLWKNGLGVIKEDVGGSISRTVSISVDTGEIVLSNSKDKWVL
ncbi:MAG: chemotaxis protein CheD [Spirochaetota bacterium]